MEQKLRALITMTLFISLLFVTPSYAKEEISVHCFVGNPADNEYLGTIELYNTAYATSSCNEIFSECEGRCVGCFADSESIEKCIDQSGNLFRD